MPTCPVKRIGEAVKVVCAATAAPATRSTTTILHHTRCFVLIGLPHFPGLLAARMPRPYPSVSSLEGADRGAELVQVDRLDDRHRCHKVGIRVGGGSQARRLIGLVQRRAEIR